MFEISNILGLGLICGLIISLISYLILKFQGKQTPRIRKGVFLLLFLIFLMFLTNDSNVYKLFLELIVIAIIISFFFNKLIQHKFIESLNQRKIEFINTAIYIVSIIIGLTLMLLKSPYLIIYVSNILEMFIIFLIGTVISIKLLWT